MIAAAGRSLIAAALAGAFFLDQSSAATARTPSTSTQNRSITITVFNGFATIRDVRTVALGAGDNHIAFPGVAPLLEPQSVFFTDVRSGHPLWVVEQNLNGNVVNGSSLLQAFVGRTVTVIETNPTTGREKRESAVVLSADGPLLKFADRIETGVPPFGRIVYPSLPPGMVTVPMLEADLAATAPTTSRIALTYLTDGFSWNTDYVLRLHDDMRQADIDALATVSDASGIDFDDVNLQLVSGDVQRLAAQQLGSAPKVLGEVTTTSDTYAVAGASVVRQPLFEFYLYSLHRRTSLKDKYTKQFSLFSAQDVPIDETYEVQDTNSADALEGPQGDQRLPVEAFVGFTDQGPELGIPLPSGTAHVYKDDGQSGQQFVGDAGIDRTPVLGRVHLDLGQSYDVRATRVQTNFHIVEPQGHDPRFAYSTQRITVTNAKQRPVMVKLFEYLPDNWTILAKSAPYVKLSSGEVEWSIPVPARGTAQIEYAVRVIV